MGREEKCRKQGNNTSETADQKNTIPGNWEGAYDRKNVGNRAFGNCGGDAQKLGDREKKEKKIEQSIVGTVGRKKSKIDDNRTTCP